MRESTDDDNFVAFLTSGHWHTEPHLWEWCRSDTTSASLLTVLIVDDEIDEAMSTAAVRPGKGSGVDLVCRAAQAALEHPAVQRVLLTGHDTDDLDVVANAFPSAFTTGTVCLLLDIFDKSESPALGRIAADYLLNRKRIPPHHCALFSRRGDRILRETFKIPTHISKNTSTVDGDYEQAVTMIIESVSRWLHACAEYHKIKFYKAVGDESLRELASKLQSFHDGDGRHTITAALRNHKTHLAALAELELDILIKQFIADLVQSDILSQDAGEKLFYPVAHTEKCSPERVFSFTKALSRRSKKAENTIPSYWIESLLGLTSAPGIDRRALKLSAEVPASGYLAAMVYLRTEVCKSIEAIFDGANGQLFLTLHIDANQDGESKLKELSENIVRVSDGVRSWDTRPGQTVPAFEALFVGGWSLHDSPRIADDTLHLTLRAKKDILVYLD
jgi:hypothetical protein